MNIPVAPISQVLKPTGSQFNILDRHEKTKFLCSNIGIQTEYLVRYKSNDLTVYNAETKKAIYKYTFNEGSNIIDIDYFPSIDGKFGIIVAVNDPLMSFHCENYIVELTSDNGTKKILKIASSLSLKEKVTVFKVIFSNEDMDNRKNQLNIYKTIYSWPHCIAIGMENAHCLISHLIKHPSNTPFTEVAVSNTKPVDIFASMIDEKGKFVYTFSDAFKIFPLRQVYPTSFGFLPRSKTLIVGMSMGGIMVATLNTSNILKLLDLTHEKRITHIVPIEPEDDPDKYEYFFTVTESSATRPVVLHMFRGREADRRNADSWEGFLPMFEHYLRNGKRCITAKTMAHDRSLVSPINRIRSEDSFHESSMVSNVSMTFGSSVKRSLAIFLYEKGSLSNLSGKTPSLAAAIFDMDSFYYKRTPPGVSYDKTILRQCAFLSEISSNLSIDDVQDMSVLLRNPNDMTQFSSIISDADQLFYSSALNLNRVFVADSTSINCMKVVSIHENLIDHIAENVIKIFLRNPDETAKTVIATGMVPQNMLCDSPNSSMNTTVVLTNSSKLSPSEKVILTVLFYYGRVNDAIKLIKSSTVLPSQREQMIHWAFYECCDFRNIVIERVMDLFESITRTLSPIASRAIFQAIQLFKGTNKFLTSCLVFPEHKKRVEKFLVSIQCFTDHMKLVRQFVINNVVPQDYRISKKMKENHNKKLEIARRNQKMLPIQLVLQRLRKYTDELIIWNDMSVDEWYPPKPFILLEPLFERNVPITIKRDLIIQYVADWVRASISNDENIDLKEVARRTLNTMGDYCLHATIDRILYVLENENDVLHEKIDKEATNEKSVKLVRSDENFLVNEVLSAKDEEKYEQWLLMNKDLKKISDPEEHRKFQMFLLNRQKFEKLSEEFLDSNELIKKLVPNLIMKNGKNMTKTIMECDRMKEVRSVVHSAIARSSDSNDSANSTAAECSISTEKVQPPKPAQLLMKKTREAFNRKRTLPVPTDTNNVVLTTEKEPKAKRRSEVMTPPKNNSEDMNEEDSEFEAAVKTPARYLKKIMANPMTSPPRQPTTAFNVAPSSILKSSKAQQSPSRGRIRFAEKLESAAKIPNNHRNFVKILNFDDLDDIDEHVASTSEASLTNDEVHLNPLNSSLTSGKISNSDFNEMEKTLEVMEDRNIEVATEEIMEDRNIEVATEEVMEDEGQLLGEEMKTGENLHDVTEELMDEESEEAAIEKVEERGNVLPKKEKHAENVATEEIMEEEAEDICKGVAVESADVEVMEKDSEDVSDNVVTDVVDISTEEVMEEEPEKVITEEVMEEAEKMSEEVMEEDAEKILTEEVMEEGPVAKQDIGDSEAAIEKDKSEDKNTETTEVPILNAQKNTKKKEGLEFYQTVYDNGLEISFEKQVDEDDDDLCTDERILPKSTVPLEEEQLEKTQITSSIRTRKASEREKSVEPTRPKSKLKSVSRDEQRVEVEEPATPSRRTRKASEREKSVEPSRPKSRLKSVSRDDQRDEVEEPVTPSRRTRKASEREKSVEPSRPMSRQRSTRVEKIGELEEPTTPPRRTRKASEREKSAEPETPSRRTRKASEREKSVEPTRPKSRQRSVSRADVKEVEEPTTPSRRTRKGQTLEESDCPKSRQRSSSRTGKHDDTEEPKTPSKRQRTNSETRKRTTSKNLMVDDEEVKKSLETPSKSTKKSTRRTPSRAQSEEKETIPSTRTRRTPVRVDAKANQVDHLEAIDEEKELEEQKTSKSPSRKNLEAEVGKTPQTKRTPGRPAAANSSASRTRTVSHTVETEVKEDQPRVKRASSVVERTTRVRQSNWREKTEKAIAEAARKLEMKAKVPSVKVQKTPSKTAKVNEEEPTSLRRSTRRAARMNEE